MENRPNVTEKVIHDKRAKAKQSAEPHNRTDTFTEREVIEHE